MGYSATLINYYSFNLLERNKFDSIDVRLRTNVKCKRPRTKSLTLILRQPSDSPTPQRFGPLPMECNNVTCIFVRWLFDFVIAIRVNVGSN